MRKIRNNVFETNSSSTHSISFGTGDFVPTKMYVDVDGVCTIYPGCFGWEIEEYSSPCSKASYALTYAAGFKNPETRRQHLEMLNRVIAKEVNATVAFDLDLESTDWERNGYIDHQSDYVCAEAFESDELLRRFIFDLDTILYTDNDNH